MELFRSLAAAALLIGAGGGCITTEHSVPQVRFVAHRGESITAPENTREAYELAWRNGHAWGVETDVHLTGDGVLVCSHDPDTKRTSGVDWKIAEKTVEELKTLDVGKWKSPEYTGVKIPTLREVLTTMPPDGHIFVEIKQAGEGFAEAFRNAFSGGGVRSGQISFISFNINELRNVRKLLPQNRTLLLVGLKFLDDGTISPSAEELVATLEKENFTGVDVGAGTHPLPREYVDTIHDAGYEIHVWTVNDTAAARKLAELGVDSITTDCATKICAEW